MGNSGNTLSVILQCTNRFVKVGSIYIYISICRHCRDSRVSKLLSAPSSDNWVVGWYCTSAVVVDLREVCIVLWCCWEETVFCAHSVRKFQSFYLRMAWIWGWKISPVGIAEVQYQPIESRQWRHLGKYQLLCSNLLSTISHYVGINNLLLIYLYIYLYINCFMFFSAFISRWHIGRCFGRVRGWRGARRHCQPGVGWDWHWNLWESEYTWVLVCYTRPKRCQKK